MTQRQLTLFPSRDSVEQVEQEAIAMLPIENANVILALLKLHENTILAGETTNEITI